MATRFVILDIGDVFPQAAHARLSGEMRATPLSYICALVSLFSSHD